MKEANIETDSQRRRERWNEIDFEQEERDRARVKETNIETDRQRRRERQNEIDRWIAREE